MMGRTHLAIGVFTAAAGAAFTFHGGVTGNEKELVNTLGMIGASAVGALAPDLDHPTSMLTLKLAKYAKFATAAVIGLGIVELGMATHIVAWVIGAAIWLAISIEHSLARKATLSIIGGGAIFAGITHHVPLWSSISLGAWCGVVAFSAHRTWSHGIPAFALFGVGMFGMLSHLHLTNIAIGLIAGYISHLVADGIAGGVPLFYPFVQRRVGVQLVKTNSGVDHLIGIAAWVGAVAVLFA